MENKFFENKKGKIKILDRSECHKIVHPYWIYMNNLISPKYYELVYKEVFDLTEYYDVKIFGKVTTSKRK